MERGSRGGWEVAEEANSKSGRIWGSRNWLKSQGLTLQVPGCHWWVLSLGLVWSLVQIWL